MCITAAISQLTSVADGSFQKGTGDTAAMTRDASGWPNGLAIEQDQVVSMAMIKPSIIRLHDDIAQERMTCTVLLLGCHCIYWAWLDSMSSALLSVSILNRKEWALDAR